ncbi:RNA-directed DNA polymerase from mobile element jockey [Trichonephila inaurata madagascariensis]|uniref:RNA-directed DNA polymerase from mobile element jockey n=1 Tax=Trichonephila inaurata madagascariensis TaxID=2747483 RepID=A0A8X7BWT2_9ARAC|nr:RNA-directed DNA polymerase from mobile element jockey [Trichonephila inaurata madagascariensis]
MDVRASTPVQHVRPPPPITIDNIEHPAQLLKRIQDLTQQKIVGRMRGKSIKLYPETPSAYNRIRSLIDSEKLQSFTYQFPEEKVYKVVIRGMPSDMPVEDIVEELEQLGIHPKECKVLISRKNGLPMPLFSVFLDKTSDNKNIYNLKELCSMKIEVDTMRRKFGPAQCYRCQGFFHSSRFCTRNPKCVKCGKPHLTKDCTKTRDEEPTCCHCQGKHPANYTGCPRNPLNKPPPPPKVNFWEERARKKKEMQEAAKALVVPAVQPTNPPPAIAEVTPSSPRPQCPLLPRAVEPQLGSRPVTSSDILVLPPTSSPLASPHDTNSLTDVFSQPTPRETLKIVTWNADSIRQKIAEFEEYVNRHDPDIVALQETFLQPYNSLNIPNYTTYRNDRLTHRGGGTAILIKNSIAHHSIDIRTPTIENTAIVVEGSHKVTICSIYRPPQTPAQNLITDLQRILRNRTHCFIVGDFNAVHRTWSPHSRTTHCGCKLFNFIRSGGYLMSFPAEPTTVPVRANQRPSTIDFAISCGLDNILVQSHVELSSDHNPVQFIVPISGTKPYIQNCITFTNWNLFQDLLATSIPGNPPINSTDDVDEKIPFLTNITYNIDNASDRKQENHPKDRKQENHPKDHKQEKNLKESSRSFPFFPRNEKPYDVTTYCQ